MSIIRLIDTITNSDSAPANLYNHIDWPEPPDDRPYVYINMASTVDGKIVLGEVGGPAKGVGGPTDQLLFRRLQTQCDAAFVGSSTLRASQVIYPPTLPRITVTRSGNLPLSNRFFTDAPTIAYVAAPESLPQDAADAIEKAAKLIRLGESSVDLGDLLEWVRTKLGVKTLLCEGGPEINDQLIRAGLVDELFLTLAPKLKGGAHIPSIVTGDGFPSGISMPVTLISAYLDGNELYLRYRLPNSPTVP